MRDAGGGKRGRRCACSDADLYSRRHYSRAYRCRTRHAAENASHGEKKAARASRDPLRALALATHPFAPTQRLLSPPRPSGRSPCSPSSAALAAASSESLRLVEMRTPRDAPDLSGTISTRSARIRHAGAPFGRSCRGRESYKRESHHKSLPLWPTHFWLGGAVFLFRTSEK